MSVSTEDPILPGLAVVSSPLLYVLFLYVNLTVNGISLLDAPAPNVPTAAEIDVSCILDVAASKNLSSSSSSVESLVTSTARLIYPLNTMGMPFIITSFLSTPFILILTVLLAISDLNDLGIGASDMMIGAAPPVNSIVSPITLNLPE